MSSYKTKYVDYFRLFEDLKYKENNSCFSSSYCPQNRKLFKLIKPLLSKYYPGSYAVNFIKTLKKYTKVNYKRQKIIQL